MKKITTVLVCTIILLSSCLKKQFIEDIQDNPQKKPIEEYFDFKTTTEIYNNKNRIKRIEDHFKAVHVGADIQSGFGLIFNGAVTAIAEEASKYFAKEENNQYMMIEDVLGSIESETSIVRTFGATGISMTGYDTTVNPFIVPHYVKGEKNRKEVHLPKSQASPWANKDLIGTAQDAYYLDVVGKYPFAIKLVDVIGWKVVTDTKRIGSNGEYPTYNGWVDSRGASNRDWYIRKE
ncbi:MAG: LruC domain-containing protein [Phocaeicola sp.]